MNNNLLKLTALASELKPKHLSFANGILSGKTQKQAYIDAGYATKGANAHASRLASNGSIKKYIEFAKQDVQEAAQATLAFDEHKWLLNQKRILAMAFGDSKIKKHVIVVDGNIEVEISETNLAAANKAQELVARRMGWLTDSKKVQTDTIEFHIDLR